MTVNFYDLPGPKELLGGNRTAGFYGEATPSELVTGVELCYLIGLSAGILQHSDTPWLKFSYEGKTQFVAKKAIRYNLSWDHINAAGAVFGKEVTIKGQRYKVRLMKGANKDQAGAYQGAVNHGSEWNKLMLPIHEQAISKDWAYPANVESTVLIWAHSLGTGKSSRYTDADLLTHRNHGNGSYSWHQEVAESSTYRVLRGLNGVSFSLRGNSSFTDARYGFRPVLEVVGTEVFNQVPSVTVSTTNNRTLYEQDTISLTGNAKDTDSGDVVTVRYSINNSTTRAINTTISTGANIPFNKTLTFKSGKLYDGATAVTGDLAEGTQHFFKIWATDDKDGKSAEKTINFYVVPNRPPKLTLEPFIPSSDLIDTDKATIQGNAINPDENGVTVDYKIANGSYKEVYSDEGEGGDFSFQVPLSDLKVGKNTLTIRSTDYYGATDIKTLDVTKDENLKPLKTAVARYKLSPPNGTAKGIVLWIEREVGDLVIDAEIHMGANGEAENFKKMTKSSTAFVREGIEEDEFTFEDTSSKENIILKLTMERTSTVSNKGITLISGVLS